MERRTRTQLGLCAVRPETAATNVGDHPVREWHRAGIRDERNGRQAPSVPLDRIRLSGEGEAGPEGGPPGDLFVQMSVKQHPIFERDGKNLYCEVPITFVAAALGGELEVPTLDGRVNLKIPAETQTGKLFRLRGKGVKPVRGGSVGDLLCRAVVETPVNLNKEQKELLQQFQESLGEGGHAQSPRQTSFFEGVKNFFDDMKP